LWIPKENQGNYPPRITVVCLSYKSLQIWDHNKYTYVTSGIIYWNSEGNNFFSYLRLWSLSSLLLSFDVIYTLKQ
jgi:hypothetical protein